MRLALVTWSRRRAGGVETYVEQVLGALHQAGHDVSLWFEDDEPADAPLITLPPGAESHRIRGPVDAAMAWDPDALVVNGLKDVEMEARLLAARPTLYVAHNFYGTCISGKKSWSAPVERPCGRRFGAGCLAHYFPHRCGGLNPLTMVSLYTRERRRLDVLGGAHRIVTLSEFMRSEYLHHGFDDTRVVCVPYGGGLSAAPIAGEPHPVRGSLVFIGRLERLKGAHVLLEALPMVASMTGRPVSLAVLGDGPERQNLERQARDLAAAIPGITVLFDGRVDAAARDRRLSAADLLVVPSLWPEPFGLVGLEAARLGVPAVAFDVGGIRQWLAPDQSGALAPADPPTASGLAETIGNVLLDRARLGRLRGGAIERARAAPTPAMHAAALVALLPPASQDSQALD
jgi:glycosyltransferase involved in cell wall biosynthesis